MRFFVGERISHPFLSMILAPLERLQAASWVEKILGLVGGALAWVISDAFTVAVMLLVASGTADTIYGRALAAKLDKFDQTKADIGLQSKIMGVVLTLLIRGFEGWWSNLIADGPFDGYHTAGYLSMAVAITLFVNDLKSIQKKRERFGQPPLPVLGYVLDVLDRIAAALGAGPPKGRDIIRRSSDPPEDQSHLNRRADDPDPEDDRRER